MRPYPRDMKVFSANSFFSIIFLILTISPIFLFGCAGENARNVARIELANVVTYEKELDKKIKAEETFYRLTAKDIEERFEKESSKALDSAIISGALRFADLFIGLNGNTFTDWYAPDYFESLTDGQRDPQGPDRPSAERLRVIRGGSWEDNGVWARTVHRGVVPDGHFNKSIGMRCVYDVHPDAANVGVGAGAADAPPLVSGDDGTATQVP